MLEVSTVEDLRVDTGHRIPLGDCRRRPRPIAGAVTHAVPDFENTVGILVLLYSQSRRVQSVALIGLERTLGDFQPACGGCSLLRSLVPYHWGRGRHCDVGAGVTAQLRVHRRWQGGREGRTDHDHRDEQ